MSVHVHPSVIFMCTISHHYMSVIRSVIPRPAHVFLFFCICMPVHLPIHHIHTHNVFYICLCVCVFASICPYIMFTAMCPCVCHIHIYYTSLPYISTTVCRSTVRVFVYVYFHLNILHVQLFGCLFVTSCAIPLPQYVSVCLAIHSSKFRLCLSVSLFSFVSVTIICTKSLHTCPNVCLSVLCPTHIFLSRLFGIHMLLYHIYSYVSIYLSVTFIHTISPICVCHCFSLSFCLSLSLSLCFYVIISVYHVYNCVRLSVTFMSYTCFHINSSYQLTELCRHACQSACLFTCVSICFLCRVAHLSVLLSYFTFSTYYHYFNISFGLRCCRFAYTVTTSTSADLT